jgi:hypothetical protein
MELISGAAYLPNNNNPFGNDDTQSEAKHPGWYGDWEQYAPACLRTKRGEFEQKTEGAKILSRSVGVVPW